MNKVILIGRLTADPEYKQTAAGIAYCRFSLAVDRPAKSGEERQADFIRISAWRTTADFIARYFTKGKKIVIEGTLRNNDYTDNNGVKHYSMEVIAQNVEFGESKSAAGSTGGGEYKQQPAQSAQNAHGNVQHGQAAPQNGNKPQTARQAAQPQNLTIGNLSAFEDILSDGDLPF